MNRIVTKVCKRCRNEKPTSEFHKDAAHKDGLHNWCKDCEKAYHKQRRSNPGIRDKDRAGSSNRQLKKLYGISLDEYERLLEKQNGVCAVCGKPPNGRRLHVDHDHRTGAVRGLLCSGCNVALGAVDDSPSILQRLINYLTGKD